MQAPNKIVVFGSGRCAAQTAARLGSNGFEAVVVCSDQAVEPPGSEDPSGRIRRIEGARLVSCTGQAGAFDLLLQQPGARSVLKASAIIVAEEARHTPNFAAYGLQSSPRVVSLADLEQRLESSADLPFEDGAWVAFFNSWQSESHPAMAARMLRLCLRLQRGSALRTVYLTGNLKVASFGAEACYQAAKSAGALFLKFGEKTPGIAIEENGRVRVTCRDETTRTALSLLADYVVVDESIQVHPDLAHLAEVLRLERDAAGYIQSDNVRRLTHLTNRRGIFVSGPSRAVEVQNQTQVEDEAAALVSTVGRFLDGIEEGVRPAVRIDPGRCARCLTCYRLCPYAAVEIGSHMLIAAEACQGCGLCAAGCPNQAIQVEDKDLTGGLQLLLQGVQASDAVPPLALFCCRRSASQARAMALGTGKSLPAGLIFIEGLCSGTFSVAHLLSAFEAGVQGVMVLGCHPGNCHSETGTLNARKRAAQAARALAEAGVEPERVAYATLSANMGSEFARQTQEFAGRIASLGPSGKETRSSARETCHELR